MTDLTQIAKDALDRLTDDGKMQEIVDKHIEKALDDAVRSALGPFSDFSKAFEAGLKEALPTNVDGIVDLGHYNELVMGAVRQRWLSQSMPEAMVERFMPDVKGVLEAVPDVINLSAILEAFEEEHREKWEESAQGEYTCYFESDDDMHTIEFFTLGIDDDDPGAGLKRYMQRRGVDGCDIRIRMLVRKNDDTETPEEPMAEVFGSLNRGMSDMREVLSHHSMPNEAAKLLAQAYYLRVPIRIDIEEHDGRRDTGVFDI